MSSLTFVKLEVFDITEETTLGGHCKISICLSSGEIVDEITKPTQREALDELQNKGYRRAMVHDKTILLA